MFKRIKKWLASRYLQVDAIIAPTPTHQVDQRDIETRKRVRKAFDAQAQQMQSRALKAHDPSCKDLDSCKKRKCFKWQPDKIISESYDVPPRK